MANNIVPPSVDESIFDYMKAPVTDSMFLFDTDELEIAKIVGINDMRTNTSPLFYECGILKFVDLIAYKTLIVMF